MPVEVEDGLAGAGTRVDDDPIVVEALLPRGRRDEVEHPLRLLGGELADLVEARDVALGQDEQMRVRLRVDVADRDESVGTRDVVAVPVEPAEEAVLRQRGSPPA
jgi:hypothetical protein